MSNRPIADHDTPDPWLIPHPSRPSLFYLTFTLGNRIEIWSSDHLESFHDSKPSLRKTVIWQPPPGSPWSADIWAPELHFLFGTWWVYAAATSLGVGNPGHRTVVLRCTDPNGDPMQGGSWVFEGPLRGVPDHQWAIDATVFSPDLAGHEPGGNGRPDEHRRWYVCYSGWPLGDHSDTQQDLFLARLRNPLEADEASLTCIGKAELPWERPDGGRRGVNEGPSWVAFPNGQWRGIVYSGHGSWTSEYKLGLLQFVGGHGDDLCNTTLWKKRPTPLLVSDKEMGGPFGPGHASFVQNPGDDRVFCVYHGTENEGEGWNNRKARVLCMDSDAFVDGGRTMCCAYSVCGPINQQHEASSRQGGQGAGQNQNWQQQQQQLYQQPAYQQQQQQYHPHGQNQGGYGQSNQAYNQTTNQTFNQDWQGRPIQQQNYQQPPPPQSASQSYQQYPGQQSQTQYPGQYNQQPQPQQHNITQYTTGQTPQHFQPPPSSSSTTAQGYPPPPQQMAPGQPTQPIQSFYQPGQPTQQPQYHPQSHPQSQPGQGQGQSQGNITQQYQQYQTQGYGQPSGSRPPGSGSGTGTGSGSIGKYADQIQKKIPAQYQGYFEKAKKFLK